MSDVERFDRLKTQFIDAHAQSGRKILFLQAATGAEFREHRDEINSRAEILGFVPVGENIEEPWNSPGYYIAINKIHPIGSITEWVELFKSLAAQGGAMLPLSIRRGIPFEPAQPISWWLSLLWYLRPPTEDELEPIPPKARILWTGTSPFELSIQAIEQCRLNSDSPTWPSATLAEAVTPQAAGEAAECEHNPDFSSVKWFGATYRFSPNQAKCVKMLWENWLKGFSVSGQTLRDNAEISSERLDVVFRNKDGYHSAWKTMIVSDGKGLYRLAKPEPAPAKQATKHRTRKRAPK